MGNANPFSDLVVGADDFAREVKEGQTVPTADAGTLQQNPAQAVSGPERFADLRDSARAFGGAVREEEESDQKFQQQITAYTAAHQDADPATQVEVLKYSAATGLPPQVVEGQLDTLRKTVDSKALAAALANRPQFAALIADASKAPIVKDDAASLGWMEWALTGKWETVPHTIFSSPNPLLPNIAIPVPEMTVGPGWARAFQNAVTEQKVVALSAKQTAGLTSKEEDAELNDLEEKTGERDYGANNPLSKGVIGAAKMLPYIGGSIAARGLGLVGGTLGGAIGGAGAGAETGPGAAVTGAVGGISGAGFGEWAGGAAFDFYQNVGPQFRALKKLKDGSGNPLLTDDEARTYAITASAIAAGVMSGLGGKIVKSLPGVKPLFAKLAGRALAQALEKPTTAMAVKKLGTQYVTHLAAGGLMMAAQAAANTGSEEIAKANHGQEGSVENVAVAMGEAFTRGIQDMTVIAAIGPGREFLQDVGVSGKVSVDQRRLSVLLQAAKESKLLDRSPEEFRKFAEKVAANGADADVNVHIPVEEWSKYWQGKKIDPGAEAGRVLKDEGKSFAEAVATKGDIAIPLKDFLTEYSKNEHGEALAPDTKLSGDGRTARQEAAFQKQLKAKLEKSAKERATELDSGEKAVHEFIRDQALAADITKTEADAVAQQVAKFARTMALRLNVSVDEAAMLGGLSHLRILGPKGDLIAEAARKRFVAEVAAPSASKHLGERLTSMTDAEARAREIYIDRVSGLRNARVFDETPTPEGKSVAIITSPSVKGINDHDTAGGHDVANDLLRNIGVSLGEVDPNAARGGTNFRFLVDKGHEEEQLAAAIEKVKAALPDSNIDLIGVHGADSEKAFANLKTETDRRRALDATHAEHIPARGALRPGLDVSKLAFKEGRAKADLPPELVSRVEGLSDKAFFQEAYLDKIFVTNPETGEREPVTTGLLTAEGFHNTPPKAHTLSIDLKGLGKVPKHVGDQMLLIFAQHATHFGGSSFDAAHLSGDEFAAKHDDPAALEKFAAGLKQALTDQIVRFKDPASGEKIDVAVDFRHGIGRDYAEADRDLNKRRRAEEAGVSARGDGAVGEPGARPLETGIRDRGSQVGPVNLEDRRASGDGRGARPQAWADRRPVAQIEGQQVTFRKAAVDDFPGLGPVIGRMSDKNRALAMAWFEYTQGLREDRPIVPDKLKKQLAAYEVIDPLGFEWDMDGRSMRRPHSGPLRGGKEPAELRRYRLLNQEHETGEAPILGNRYDQGARAKTEAELDAETDAIFAEQDRQQAHIDRLKAEEPGPREFPMRDGGKLLISKDPSKPGNWRVTRFEKEDGEWVPTGHSDARDYGHAIERATDYSDLDYGSNLMLQRQSYFSEGRSGKGPRGMISVQVDPIGKPIGFNVTVLNGDRSTLAHETAHFLSWSLHDIATSDLSTEALRADYAGLLKWAGYDSAEQRINEQNERRILEAGKRDGSLTEDGLARFKVLSAKEERISHGWEQYLAEGKAPSKELAGTFSRFKGWMLRIYRGIGGIQDQFRAEYGEELNLSDEVRGIFDRLIGAEDALNNAQEQTQLKPFEELLQTMGETERAAYMQALGEAREGADEETNRRAAEIFHEQVGAERERIAHEVAAELDTQPIYRVMRFLQKGEFTEEDGTMIDVPDFLLDDKKRPLKLNRKKFEEKYGPEQAAQMPPGIFARTKRGGVEADQMGPMLGFGTGDEMVMSLLKAEPRDQAIARKTQERVQEVYAPALKQIADAAMSAVHNDAQARATLLELREMAKQLDPNAAARVQITDLKTVRSTAERLVGDTTLADLDPAKYQRAERAAALKRAELWASGKKAEAFEHGEARLLNQILYQVARDAKERLERARIKLESTSTAIRGKLGLAGVEYRDGHDDVLAAVGLGPMRTGAPPGLDALMKRAEADGQPIDFDVPMIRELMARPRPWESLTTDQARAVADAVTNIRHIAKQALELVLAGKKQTKDSFFNEMASRLASRKPQDLVPFSQTAEQATHQRRHLLRGADAILSNIDTFAAMLDAGDRNGPAHRLFVDGRQVARDQAAELERKVLKPIRERWENVPKELQKLRDEVVDVGELLPVPLGTEGIVSPTYTRDSLWALFLNWGNDGNRQRIRDGNGWTDNNVEKALSLLSKPELQFLQGVLDTINSLYPEIARVHRGRSGLDLEKVEAAPILINGESYPGGYFPLRADSRFSKVGEMMDADQIANILQPNYVPASTPRGHTKERADKAAYVVKLNWAVVPAHLAQVIHDITHGDWVRQTAGVILDERFKSMVTQYLGRERMDQFVPWLKDVANQRADSAAAVSSDFSTELGAFARNRVAAAALLGNFGTLVQNFTDPFNAVQEDVGATHIALAYAKMMNPGNWNLPEFKLSKELQYRDIAFRDNMRKTLGEIGPRKHGLGDALRETGFGLFEQIDRFTTRVGFLGAFKDATSRGLSETEAAKFADDVVRKMWASHDVAEKSKLLRTKSGIGAVLMFYSFANRSYNSLRRRVDRLGLTFRDSDSTAGDKAKAVGSLAGALMWMGIVGAGAKYMKGSGPKQNEDPKKWAALAVILEPLNSVPFIGPMVESLISGQKISAKAAPELALAQDSLNYVIGVYEKAKSGTATDGDKALAAILALTAIAGGPVAQVKKTGSYINKLASGQAKQDGVADVASGLLYGPRETANPIKDVGRIGK